MKYISIAAIVFAVVGCSNENTQINNEASNIGDYGPPQITVGQNANVMWKCQKDAVSENSVWIDCSFTNGSKFSQTTCINVYYDRDHTFILANNKVCSGTIPPGGVAEAHAAFIRDKRISVNELCGPSLDDCKLNSVERVEVSDPIKRKKP